MCCHSPEHNIVESLANKIKNRYTHTSFFEHFVSQVAGQVSPIPSIVQRYFGRILTHAQSFVFFLAFNIILNFNSPSAQAQELQVLRHMDETPGKAHLLAVDLVATQEQRLVLTFPLV